MEARQVLKHVDHTVLGQTAAWTEREQDAECLNGKLPVRTVIGFPHGTKLLSMLQRKME